jgi:putative FmdB family regulatory protein
MPTYVYECNACQHIFEEIHTMKEHNTPTKKPCPICNEKRIKKSWKGVSPALSADNTLTPDKATGGKWGEMMNRIKGNIPKRYHEKIDKSSNMTGKRWYG